MNAVDLLRALLQAPSVNPPGEEWHVCGLLDRHLSEAGLQTKILTSPGGRVNLVARLDGPTDRPALVLLSHSDVVPVETARWTHDPFGAELSDGFVWGRGALDMKSMSVMHAMAAAELARSRTSPGREVIVAVVADEEAGGDEGARWLLNEHAGLLGFDRHRPPPEVLGEGAYGVTGTLARPVIPIAVGEKTAVWFDILVAGEPGHGALPPQDQAILRLLQIVEHVAGFGTPRIHPVVREQCTDLANVASGPDGVVLRALASPAGSAVARALAPRLRKEGPLGLLLSDSVTATRLAAGYKANVVPGEARASFDARLLPDTDVDAFLGSVAATARRRGGSVTEVVRKGRGPVSVRGPLFDVLAESAPEVHPDALATVGLSPGITDLRFFRDRGATGYGWCPLILPPSLLATIHGDDERVPVDDFERAVAVTADVVRRASS